MKSAASTLSSRISELSPPHPSSPLNGAVVDSSAITFVWNDVPGATSYCLQVAPDRQFARDVIEINVGMTTSAMLHDTLPPSETARFWRVLAETPDGPTPWSPYGRFYSGSDASVDVFRSQREAEERETRKQVARQQAEEEAKLNLIPFVERDDTIPSRREAGNFGIAMILSLLLVAVVIALATLGAW